MDLCGAPALRLDNILYNCTECSSIIEIISLNEEENIIEFKCLNKHYLKMNIKEYINKMKKYNDIKLNDKKCNKHNNEVYFSYCFDCNIHLCKECMKSKEHNYHYKIYMLEIIPDIKVLNDIEDIIKQNKIKIANLNDEKTSKEKKLESILKHNINKIKEKKDKKKEQNKNEENKEIKINKDKYISNLNRLKREYEIKLKNIKLDYKQNIIKIKNKYKNINNENESIFIFKILLLILY